MTVKFLDSEIRALQPPEDITVSQWADKYRILSPKTSKEPGKWKTERVPYTKFVMDQFNNHEVEEIILCWSAQVSKTESMMNMLAYAIDQDPGPAMFVFPDEDTARYASKNRIQIMLEDSPKLKKYIPSAAWDMTNTEMQLETMIIYIVWAGSPAKLASKPVRYVFFDEVDKYPAFSGKEADPIALAKERTNSYRGFHKIIMASTPTTEDGNIWRELNKCNAIYRYAVPCPHCKQYQFLEFQNIIWDEDVRDPEQVREIAQYSCEHCGALIEENEKQWMLQNGRWEIVEEKSDKRRKIGFHLSALYSPFLSWGELAAEFLESKDDTAKLMNFINSKLAEPFKEVVNSRTEDEILSLKNDLDPAVAPENSVAILASVDTQKDGFYYTIWAFDNEVKGHLLRYGFAHNWSELELVLFKSEYRIKGYDRSVPVIRVFIDSGGDKTEEVYRWSRKFRGVVFPVKGSSQKMGVPYKESIIDKLPNGKRFTGGLRLVLIDTEYYKDAIARRLETEGLSFHKGTGVDFALQMIAEEKRRVRKGNTYVEKWVRIHKHNHYLDCTVYALACADHLQVSYLKPIIDSFQKPVKKQTDVKEIKEQISQNKTGWLGRRKGWLR